MQLAKDTSQANEKLFCWPLNAKQGFSDRAAWELIPVKIASLIKDFTAAPYWRHEPSTSLGSNMKTASLVPIKKQLGLQNKAQTVATTTRI